VKTRALPRQWEAAVVVLITLLAAALRFYRLTELPPGLHFDEGFKGVTARSLLAGAPAQPFFESDMGEEPIAIYLVAASLGLVGQHPWAVRLPSAIVGTLTVPLAWWLGRELLRAGWPAGSRTAGQSSPVPAAERGGEEGAAQIVGLGTALVLAILYWHVSFSRIGMEPILVPFFATLAFAALLRGLNTGRWPAFALAGLALGGSLYTYKAGYFIPIVAVLFVAYTAGTRHGIPGRQGRGVLLTALLALLVAAPIMLYFAAHPANFLQRPASVALVGGEISPESPWRVLGENLPRVLGMFFLQGDANPRSNLPLRPALDPFLACLFLVGLAWTAWASLRGRPVMALPWLWLGVLSLPTLLTTDAPHFGRAIGATPAIALLCALGLAILDSRFPILDSGSQPSSLPNPKSKIQNLKSVLLALGLVFSTVTTARAYFCTWGRSPDLFYAYDVGLAGVADYINAVPAGQEVVLTPTDRDHYTLQFLVHRPLISFDGRAGLVLPPPAQAATVIVLLREDEATLPVLQRLRPDGQVVWTLADDYGRPYAAAYSLPATVAEGVLPPAPDHPADVTFGRAARLLGYSLDRDTVRPGGLVNLTLYWQALAPLPEDYTVFTHLLGTTNPNTGSPVWAGHDGQPDGGNYPTTDWQPGQVILDVHPLAISADAPPGEVQLEAGLYLLSTLTRLPAIDGVGQRLPADAARLGTIRVTE
jgi:hypothetical protein